MTREKSCCNGAEVSRIGIYGTSYGFGLQTSIGGLEDVRVDYAYTNVDFFDGLNTFTFEIGF